MYQIFDQSSGNIIGLSVSEKLTGDDYETLIPILEKAIDEYGKIRLFWNMDDFSGWNLNAALKDLKFDATHAQDIERLALVENKPWQKWMLTLSELFGYENVKYFEQSQFLDAWAWIQA